jgi:ParB family chromosome partitioning protein
MISLTENVQREDLNPLERAQGMARLLNEFRLTQQELAESIGMSQPAIAHHLRLLTLPTEVQCLIEDGALSFGHGKVLAGVADRGCLVGLARTAVSSKTSVRELEILVANRQRKLQARFGRSAKAATREELELPNGVFLVLKEESSQPSCGKLEIPYYSKCERDWVIRVLLSAKGSKPREAHKLRINASLSKLQSPIALSRGGASSPKR